MQHAPTSREVEQNGGGRSSDTDSARRLGEMND